MKNTLLSFSVVSVLLFILVGTNTTNDKWNKTFRPRKLHNQTESIQVSLAKILTLVDTINFARCQELNGLQEVLEKEEKLHKLLYKMSFQNLDSIVQVHVPGADQLPYKQSGLSYDEKNRIVRPNPVYFEDKNVYTFFIEEIEEAEALAEQLQQIVKKLRNKAIVCAQRYNRCTEVIDEKGFKSRLKLIEEALDFYRKDKTDFCENETKINAIIQKCDDANEDITGDNFSRTLLSALTDFLKYQKRICQGDEKGAQVKVRYSHASFTRLHRIVASYTQDSVYNKYTNIVTGCEYDHLQAQIMASRSDELIIDSNWIVEQQYYTRRLLDGYGKRGCHIPCSPDFDASADITDNVSCRGCQDPKAKNYCPKSDAPYPCIYLICPDTTYLENNPLFLYSRFRTGFDLVEYDTSMCSISAYGCTNDDCDNYAPQAIKDDGSCDCCCSDPLAINYDSNCTDPTKKACNYTGCMSPCAENYEPNAKNDVPKGSCKCRLISEEELEQAIFAMQMHSLISNNRSPKDLRDDFNNQLSKSRNADAHSVAKSFVFSRNGNDLKIVGGIKLSGSADYIRKGAYWYPPIYEVMDSLVEFLYRESGRKDEIYSELNGYIIGEADNYPIRGKGIRYKTDGSNSISSAQVAILPPSINTSVENVMSNSFFLRPTTTFSLIEESLITNNSQLAFTRAFLVKNRLIQATNHRVPSENILIGVRANKETGGNYRKITVALKIEGFFSISVEEQQKVELKLRQYKEAKEFFMAAGYFPNSGKTYRTCPCFDE